MTLDASWGKYLAARGPAAQAPASSSQGPVPGQQRRSPDGSDWPEPDASPTPLSEALWGKSQDPAIDEPMAWTKGWYKHRGRWHFWEWE